MPQSLRGGYFSRIDPRTGYRIYPGIIGEVDLMPHVPPTQQGSAFSAMAKRLRNARTVMGDDGYPYVHTEPDQDQDDP